MRIFGFKSARLAEWHAVLVEEGKTWDWRTWLKMAALVVLSAFKVQTVSWRRKMRGCRKCPIYDRTMKRCRPYSGSPLGCGCYTPFLAVVETECWGDKNFPGRYGWSAHQ